MNARIEYRGCDREESKKLRPFLPLARYFADLWEKTVVLNSAGGAFHSPETGDEDARVHVHFYGSPSRELRPAEPLSEAFLYGVPSDRIQTFEDGTAEGADVASRVSHTSEGVVVRSPWSQKAVAQVVGNHIYILFDLAHRPWDGAVPVFFEIMERAGFSLRSGQEQGETKEVTALCKAHEVLRSSTVKRKKLLAKDFDRVSRLVLAREQDRVLRELQERRLALEDLEEQSSELASRVELLQEIMDDPKKDEDFSNDRLWEEFEAIHRLKNVLGMEVKGDALHVFTEPIEHVSTDGERRMLSQYEIIVKPWEGGETRRGNTFGAIQMKEHGWIGPYYHPETTIKDSALSEPRAPCFGGQFVSSVEKALLDHDYVVLIQLLLHYLDSDNRQCPARPLEKQSKEAYRKAPFYVSEYMRARSRDAYADFVRKFRGAFRKEALQKELSAASQEERRVSEEFQEARLQAALLSSRRQFLYFYDKALPTGEELETLLGIPALSFVYIGKNFIWLLFGPGYGEGQFSQLLFPGPFRLVIEPLRGRVRMAGAYSNSFLSNRVSSHSSEVSSSVAKTYIAKGLLGRAVKEVHDVLRGADASNSDKEAALTEEAVREYLLRHGLPSFDIPVDSSAVIENPGF